ncbi:FAD-dependent oxidoreductase [Elioraea tepidiphila]|uniref:FAD-dependent oxidoreductase n=1 Tax=Elioraea tepidiphila TaxID=457934 RepID=UPI002FD9619F
MKTVVVGAGVVGLAAAWQLARAGHAVTVVEAGPIPNPTGASWDEHRLCRLPYGDQHGYAQLMAPAMAAWERVWAALGERHYAETGCLALSTAVGDWTDRSRASLAGLGLPHRVMTPDEVAARCPFLRVDDARFGLWTAGGVLFADRITAGFAALAQAAGAAVIPESPARAVDPAGTVLLADSRTLAADAVLVAAGAWTSRLAPWVGDGLTPLRQVVVYAQPPPSLAQAWHAAPILLDMGGPRGMYAAPPVAGRRLKLGCGALNAPGDPDTPRTARPEDGPPVLAAWRERLVAHHAYRLVEARICFYANATDQCFRIARSGRAVAITGCSGHAFKFAALLGEGLAAALAGDAAPLRWIAGEAAAYARAA